ncbi:MAG: TIGR03118 family protein [Ginsengibacter sp.]
MQKIVRQNKSLFFLTGGLFLIAFLVTAPGCKKNPKVLKDFNQVNLLANNDKYGAVRVDPQLQNAWGIAFGAGNSIWVSAQVTGLSEVLDKDGNSVLPSVTIPGPGDRATGGLPSGQVNNPTSSFKLRNGKPAKFIFVGLDGVISGWNGGAAAVTAVDDSPSGAEYTGVEIAKDGGANFLYVANFSESTIDVYDSTFTEVERSFKDPYLPVGYSPFNIRLVGGWLYVEYAKLGPDGHHPDRGAGKGFVDIFKTDGSFVKRFISGGALNVPWGITKAPASFFDANMDMGIVSNAILVGNFGDGRINVYDESGRFIGPIRVKNKPFQVDQLWTITFAPATSTGLNPDFLYFTGGPADEADGLFGYITK